MEDNTTSFSPVEKKPSRKKAIWVTIIILLLIASTTALGMLYFSQQATLNADITALKDQNAQLTKDNKALQADNKDSSSSSDYREIPELGVKYKVTDKNKNVTYAYSFLDNTPSVNLRTTDIFKIANENNKDASELPAPSIVKLTEAQTKTFKVLDEDFATYQKSSPDSVKKIGQSYYIYIGPNGLDSGKTEEAIASASKGVLKDVFKNLQAI